MDSKTKLKRVVIKEELVILTGDHIKALILNQFLYWSERTKDFDKFIAEEKERNSPEDKEVNIEPSFGWIYKSADELTDELMLSTSAVTIRRHLTKLIKAGYIDQRNNPNHKWDRTLQYRPNIIAIQTDLEAMGYALDGYPLLLKDATFKMKDGNFKMKDRTSTNEGAIPETTTETTTESMPPSGENDFSDLFGEDDQSYIDIEVPENDTTSPEAKQKTVNGKPLTEAEQAHLQTFGILPPKESGADDKIYAIRQELNAAGWEIYSLDVEMAIAHFVQAVRTYHPKFAFPNDVPTRKLWYKSVAVHLQNYSLADLQSLYKQAIIKMRASGLSCWRPGSLTKWALPEVANSTGENSVTNHEYTPDLTPEQAARLAELQEEWGMIPPTK